MQNVCFDFRMQFTDSIYILKGSSNTKVVFDYINENSQKFLNHLCSVLQYKNVSFTSPDCRRAPSYTAQRNNIVRRVHAFRVTRARFFLYFFFFNLKFPFNYKPCYYGRTAAACPSPVAVGASLFKMVDGDGVGRRPDCRRAAAGSARPRGTIRHFGFSPPSGGGGCCRRRRRVLRVN